MRNRSALCRAIVLASAVLLFCQSGWSRDQTAALSDVARKDLQAAKLSEKEIQVRLKIVENVATLKAYYPHADGGRPEYRNPKYWKLDRDGSYIPRGSATQAIRDLWRTESGVRCAKLSAIVMLKAMIDVADAKQLAKLDDMLRDKVIPNGLPQKGIGTLFDKPRPKKGDIFQTAELLPGDEVWFKNPYFERLNSSLQRRYVGQEGHHVFYIGGGKVMDMYSREPLSLAEFRKTFLHWKSVQIAAEQEQLEPKSADFQIKAVRRVIIDKN